MSSAKSVGKIVVLSPQKLSYDLLAGLVITVINYSFRNMFKTYETVNRLA